MLNDWTRTTPAEFKRQVEYVLKGEGEGDHEITHAYTDDLMEDLLIELGYGESIELIRESKRWYA